MECRLYLFVTIAFIKTNVSIKNIYVMLQLIIMPWNGYIVIITFIYKFQWNLFQIIHLKFYILIEGSKYLKLLIEKYECKFTQQIKRMLTCKAKYIY